MQSGINHQKKTNIDHAQRGCLIVLELLSLREIIWGRRKRMYHLGLLVVCVMTHGRYTSFKFGIAGLKT